MSMCTYEWTYNPELSMLEKKYMTVLIEET